MHFEHLDGDILSIILHIVAHSTSKTISSWRTSIPLLHVNQRWRRLACPLVYKTALIETADADGCEPQNVVSNLPFVCAEQFHRWIRNLAVATSFEVDIVCFYSSLSTLLLQYGDRLYTTTSISQESDFWAEHGHDDAEIDGTVARLHGAVSKAMPNVRHLFLRSWEPEGVLERVFGMLADAYADQISTLDMGDMLSLPQPWAPAISLQHLDIGLANYTNMKAMLCASSASLVSLTLRNVPNDFLWKPCEFGCEYVPQTIEFPCLRKVNISFSPHSKNKPETLEPGYLLRIRGHLRVPAVCPCGYTQTHIDRPRGNAKTQIRGAWSKQTGCARIFKSQPGTRRCRG